MKYDSPFHELLSSIGRVGFKKSVLLAISRIYDVFFDFYYGIDTASRVELEDLDISEESVQKGQMYQPSGVLPFKKVLKNLDFINSQTVFVDFGSGKGRTIILAAMSPIKRSVGVEFSKELVNDADRNLEIASKRSLLKASAENVCCDAAKYKYTDDENIFYFFFPFDDEIMNKVIDGILDSFQRVPRDMHVVYYYPVHNNVFADRNEFTLVKTINAFGYPCNIYKVNQI